MYHGRSSRSVEDEEEGCHHTGPLMLVYAFRGCLLKSRYSVDLPCSRSLGVFEHCRRGLLTPVAAGIACLGESRPWLCWISAEKSVLATSFTGGD